MHYDVIYIYIEIPKKYQKHKISIDYMLTKLHKIIKISFLRIPFEQQFGNNIANLGKNKKCLLMQIAKQEGNSNT